MDSQNIQLANFLTKNNIQLENIDIIGSKSISNIKTEQYVPQNNKKYIFLKLSNELYKLEKVDGLFYSYTVNYALIDTFVPHQNDNLTRFCELHTKETVHLTKNPTVVEFKLLENDSNNSFEYDNDGCLIIKNKGIYQVICNISGYISSQFECHLLGQLFQNGNNTRLNTIISSNPTSSIDYVSMTLTGLLKFDENDTLGLLLSHVNDIPFGNVVLTENNISLSLVKISD